MVVLGEGLSRLSGVVRAVILRFCPTAAVGCGRDVAQPGSAPEWGSGGRGFKSRRPDYLRSGGATFGAGGATLAPVPRPSYEPAVRACAARRAPTPFGL